MKTKAEGPDTTSTSMYVQCINQSQGLPSASQTSIWEVTTWEVSVL